MNVFAKARKIFYDSGADLTYPYHLDFNLANKNYFSQSNKFVTDSMDGVIAKIVEEPNAFYLTGDDMKCYSKQEIDAINKVKMYLNLKNGKTEEDLSIE